MNESSNKHMFAAASVVCGLLPQVASLVVGLSALAYFAGWRVASAYYTELGAPWALSLLSSAQIMQESIGLVSIVAIIGFFSFIQLLDNPTSVKGFRRWALGTIVVAGLLVVASAFPEQWLSPFDKHMCSIIAGFMWAISAGFTVGELIGRLAEADLQWKSVHLWLVYFLVACGLWLAPASKGVARADLHGNPQTSNLPTVQIAETSPRDRWQLVNVFSGHALLLRGSEKREQRTFKVVASTDIRVIHARVR